MKIDYKHQLQRLLNKVNNVTSPLRHGKSVPIMALAELCDRQVEVEAVIAKQDVKSNSNRQVDVEEVKNDYYMKHYMEYEPDHF